MLALHIIGIVLAFTGIIVLCYLWFCSSFNDWIPYACFFCIVVGVLLIVVGGLHIDIKPMPIYRYKVKVYYIDGKTDTLFVNSQLEPRANAIRGTYFLDIPYSNNDILGVYRCEILSKEQIVK